MKYLLTAAMCFLLTSCGANHNQEEDSRINTKEENTQSLAEANTEETESSHLREEHTIITDTDTLYETRIKNILNASINVLEIQTLKKFDFTDGQVRIIVTGSGGATDFGPYKTCYLVFDNRTEMPWRYAVFKLGNVGLVETVQQSSEAMYTITGLLFQHEKKIFSDAFHLSINIEEILKQERALADSMIEQDISSHLLMSVREK